MAIKSIPPFHVQCPRFMKPVFPQQQMQTRRSHLLTAQSQPDLPGWGLLQYALINSTHFIDIESLYLVCNYYLSNLNVRIGHFFLCNWKIPSQQNTQLQTIYMWMLRNFEIPLTHSSLDHKSLLTRQVFGGEVVITKTLYPSDECHQIFNILCAVLPLRCSARTPLLLKFIQIHKKAWTRQQ